MVDMNQTLHAARSKLAAQTVSSYLIRIRNCVCVCVCVCVHAHVCVIVCVCVCERERERERRKIELTVWGEKVPIALDGIRTCISGIRAHRASDCTTTARHASRQSNETLQTLTRQLKDCGFHAWLARQIQHSIHRLGISIQPSNMAVRHASCQSKQTLQTPTRQLDRETIMHETLQLLSAGPRRQASARTSIRWVGRGVSEKDER